MEEITASVNEEELSLMHKEYRKDQNNNGNNNIVTDDMASTQDANNDNLMDYQSGQNKRPLDVDNNEEAQQPRPKFRFKNLGVVGNSSQSVNTETQISNVSDSQVSLVNNSGNNSSEAVILIKPTSDNGKELINNPLEIINRIKNSKFGKLNINDITTNKRKGLLVAKIRNPTDAIMLELLQVKALGSWPVHCYVPNRDRFKIGVISPISTDVDIRALRELMATDYKLEAVERLNKHTSDGTWVPSLSVKLVFDEPVLPNGVSVGHSFYKVRPYVSPPVQCYRCQRLGHTAHGCRSGIRCMVCGGDHVKEVCPTQVQKCANCKGQHKANSKECAFIKDAAIAERHRAYKLANHSLSQDKTFPRLRVNIAGGNEPTLPSTYPGRGMQMSSYSAIVRGESNLQGAEQGAGVLLNARKDMKEVGTQTEVVEKDKSETSFCLTQAFSESLKKILAEIFKNLKGDGLEVDKINKAVDNNLQLGTQVNEGSSSGGQRRYFTRQQNQGVYARDETCADVTDKDSLEDGVLSSSESSSDNESLYQTVEKRQIKVIPANKKAISVDDFVKASGKIIEQREGQKKKRGKGKKKY